jgi:SAM-dependent methyltransferase
MNPFDEAPEFVGEDNRQNRVFNPVTRQQMHNKHEVLFPSSLIRGKTILDLGCALGATGHWCLSNGATKYTGIEAQETYAKKARTLLDKYHANKFEVIQNSIESYLESTRETFDIVAVLGVLYVFTDYYSILRKITSVARETVIVESMYPPIAITNPHFSGVEFISYQHINLADENASLEGRGSRLSPKGFGFIMEEFGFVTEGLISPRKITESVDVYNRFDVAGPRFLLNFSRKKQAQTSLSLDLQNMQKKKMGKKHYWSDPFGV